MPLEFGDDLHLAVAYECAVRLESVGDVIDHLKGEDLVAEFGVVGGVEPYVISDFAQRHDVVFDFYSVPAGKANGLKNAKDAVTDGERYVFLGDGRRDEVLAEKLRWGYHDFDGVARQEGWDVEREA